jgi:hypothetical protein
VRALRVLAERSHLVDERISTEYVAEEQRDGHAERLALDRSCFAPDIGAPRSWFITI